MKNKTYNITLNFIHIPEAEQKERVDKITSILVKDIRSRLELRGRLKRENRPKL